MFTSKDKLLGSVELLSLIVCGLFQLLIWKCGLSKKIYLLTCNNITKYSQLYGCVNYWKLPFKFQISSSDVDIIIWSDYAFQKEFMINHFEDLNLKVDNYEKIEHLIVLWLATKWLFWAWIPLGKWLDNCIYEWFNPIFKKIGLYLISCTSMYFLYYSTTFLC